MGGYQNYGPFLGPYYNTAPIIYGTQKGTTTPIMVEGWPALVCAAPTLRLKPGDLCKNASDVGGLAVGALCLFV